MSDKIIENLKELKLKCHNLSLTTSLPNVNDGVNNTLVDLIQYYDSMKNVLKLVTKNNDNARIKRINYETRLQNALKVLNDLRQQNKVLEENISETKNNNEILEKYKQENDCLHLVYKKNISTISRLKEEVLNSSQISFNKPPLLLDLDDNFLGFDSVTVSIPESQINPPEYDSYRSLYHKIQKDLIEVQNGVNSVLTMLKKSNISFKIAMEELDSVAIQATDTAKTTKDQFIQILQNDETVTEELMKKRCVLEQIKLNSACYLNILESDMKLLGNRVKINSILASLANEKYAYWYLKKLSVQHLFSIWSKIVVQWSLDHEKVDS